jgi:ABC-2 type transport system ATP-binding protein
VSEAVSGSPALPPANAAPPTSGRPTTASPGPATTGAAGPSGAVIEVEHASRWFGNVVAVNDISFAVGAGITGLLGPNGAGKTTLLHMTAGLLEPSAGSVRIAGQVAWHDPAIYRRVGLVPEREAVYPFLTGREFAMVNAREQGLRDADAAVQRAIRLVDLEDAADRRIGTYSKGMRQRIKMAGALVHDPPVLILDEPFNGMDPRQRLHMFELLEGMADEGRTILLSSHILEEVERIASSVLVIYAGRLAASGDFRSIRRLMTDRPHEFFVRSSDDRRLGSLLLAEKSVFGVELDGKGLRVRTSDYGRFTRRIPELARVSRIRLLELSPTDDSLESVFAYLVAR